MDDNPKPRLTFREIYRRHPQGITTLLFLALTALLATAFCIYVVFTEEPRSITGYIVGQVITGLLIGWVLAVMAQKK